MALHPLAAQFADVAQEYDRGRPDYPPAAVGALAAELGLAPGARVLDLAAGTGKLTRALVAFGLDVVAVEPQEPLRALLEASAGAVEVLDGVAEAIPLPDAGVDAVTVADGFHWFDRDRALPEIARVLRPGGGLALITAAPDWGDAAWGQPLGELIAERRERHPYFDGTPFEQTLRETPGWSEPWLVQVRADQPADAQRILDYIASFSWVAGMAPDERAAFLGRAAELVDDVPPQLPVRFFMWLSARA